MHILSLLVVFQQLKKCELHHMDVHNAFLYDDLDEEMYKMSSGFHSHMEKFVAHKSHYMI